MNRKLRVLMLSVFAVLFAVSSAFAFTQDDLTAASFDVVATNDDPATIEGYNYNQKVVASWDKSKLNEDKVTISWDVHADTGEDYGNIDFLTWELNSFDVEIGGTLPAYKTGDSAINDYLLHVIAHVFSGDTCVYSLDVSENAGLTITVNEDPISVASHDIYNFSADLVSVDAKSADNNIYVVASDTYSVTITFATTKSGDETLPNTELAYDEEAGVADVYLPSWLAYEATADDGNTYVAKLRIFYSADAQPEAGTTGSVRIRTTPTVGTTYATKYLAYTSADEGYVTMGWEVSFDISAAISLDVTSFDISVKYGTSGDYGISGDVTSGDYTTYINFANQKPVYYTLSPDISADVKITASWSTDKASDDNGYIWFTVEPITPAIASYSTDVIFTDAKSNDVSLTLYIDVTMDSMEITPASASISVDVGQTKQLTFAAFNFDGKVVSWDFTAPAGISFDLVSTDSKDYGANAVFDVKGVTVGSYSFDITAIDASKRSADATVYVVVNPPAPTSFSIRPLVSSASVQVGSSTVVSFDAVNNSGDVSWDISGLPTGVTAAPANNALGDKHHAEYRIAAGPTATAGTYKATVTAEDAGGAKATATLNLTVTSASVAAFSISPATSTVSVAAGATQNVTFTAANNSGLVEWTLGTIPSGMNVATATDTSFATQNMTTMVYTVTGVTAGSTGSVTVTAKDAAGASATATISITVTGSGGGGSTPTITPTPTFTLTEALQSKIRDALIAALGSIISSSTKVVALPASALSGEIRAVGTTAIYLPEIKVSEDAIYVFNVNVATFTTGYTMVWEVTVSASETDELIQASAEEKNAIFLNDDGDIITTVPANKSVNVAAYFEAGKTYSPVIRATATAPDTGKTGVGSSSGGCSAGLGALVSVLAAAFFISKKRA